MLMCPICKIEPLSDKYAIWANTCDKCLGVRP